MIAPILAPSSSPNPASFTHLGIRKLEGRLLPLMERGEGEGRRYFGFNNNFNIQDLLIIYPSSKLKVGTHMMMTTT